MAEGGGDVGFSFEEKKGDLFGCPETDALAHCVSEDLRMGKGIAVLFKKKFGGVGELMSQGKKTGKVAVKIKKNRFIFYLITKPKGPGKPSYASMGSCLKDLKKQCIENNIHNLSMPKIGCGLDRLDWDKVTDMIYEIFSDTNIHITAYYLK
ncbi:ADP-ribose glycohydrolase OARD1-like isoform X1 [Mytilus trossulus]|uniref:ADP-ribose glycohydrolase OARD1-like isoform X1 n=1 Tax=Mytilus trossulus TaxID=6551 RepID=UPI003005FEC7